ncbi:MAG TPA: OpgC domain-containing protein, partial [Bryobacteraceae bacterium]
MASFPQLANPVQPPKPSSGRLIELDILRGFLLLWMTLTHLPTAASIISNQTFGFVSGAEGFIFLSAFMVGQLEHRMEQKRGRIGALRDLVRRTV